MWHVLWCVWCTDCLWVVDPLPLAAPDLIPGSAYSPENAEAPHSASHRALQAATANPSPGVLRDHLNFMFPWNRCLWLFKNTAFGKESTPWCSSSASPAAGSQRAIRIGEWGLQTVCVLYICAMFGNKTVKPLHLYFGGAQLLPAPSPLNCLPVLLHVQAFKCAKDAVVTNTCLSSFFRTLVFFSDWCPLSSGSPLELIVLLSFLLEQNIAVVMCCSVERFRDSKAFFFSFSRLGSDLSLLCWDALSGGYFWCLSPGSLSVGKKAGWRWGATEQSKAH